jgi:hypothetical protein
MNCRILLLIVVAQSPLVGCSAKPYEGKPRIPLTGKVTYDGKPIDGGTISFIPTDESNRVSGGPLIQGAYSVPEAKGANSGSYRVEVRWPQPTGKKYKDPDTLETYSEQKESMPKKYNTQSELTADVSETKNQFDFDLKP